MNWIISLLLRWHILIRCHFRHTSERAKCFIWLKWNLLSKSKRNMVRIVISLLPYSWSWVEFLNMIVIIFFLQLIDVWPLQISIVIKMNRNRCMRGWVLMHSYSFHGHPHRPLPFESFYLLLFMILHCHFYIFEHSHPLEGVAVQEVHNFQ